MTAEDHKDLDATMARTIKELQSHGLEQRHFIVTVAGTQFMVTGTFADLHRIRMRAIHEAIDSVSIETCFSQALIDMYAKCTQTADQYCTR